MASTLSLISSSPPSDDNLPHSWKSGHESAAADAVLAPSQDSHSKSSTTGTSAVSSPEDVYGVLRRSIADESQPPDSVIRAVSEAARVLTAADGVAIAFRTKGAILCRARSGDLAPELGSYVNANSGISGECLRTASILVCEDARTDARVDNVVCERMGIRSIVVVPLRGPVGISGILEVFSKRVNAFGNREINCLRGFAEMAETAYEGERQAQLEVTRAALRSANRLPALLARAVGSEAKADSTLEEVATQTDDPRPERLWWAIGVATVALLLMLGVYLSWHGPITELTELEAAENHARVPQATSPPREVLPVSKPEPGIFRASSLRSSSLQASSLFPSSPRTSGQRVALRSAETRASHLSVTVNGAGQGGSNSEIASAEPQVPEKPDAARSTSQSFGPPPAVNINAAQNAGELTSLISDPQPLPVMAAAVSRGVTGGELIRRVNPVYPLQARTQRITGPVVLEIHVAENGTVREVRAVSGDSQLVSAAVDAVRQWQYAPTLLDGRAIATTKQVKMIFKLP
jgi:TonB family protein